MSSYVLDDAFATAGMKVLLDARAHICLDTYRGHTPQS